MLLFCPLFPLIKSPKFFSFAIETSSETIASLSETTDVFHLLPPAQPVLSTSEVIKCALKPHITTFLRVSVWQKTYQALAVVAQRGYNLVCLENMCSALQCVLHCHIEVGAHKNPEDVNLLVLTVDGFYSIPYALLGVSCFYGYHNATVSSSLFCLCSICKICELLALCIFHSCMTQRCTNLITIS